MKNTKRFAKHCKNITICGNVEFNHHLALSPYSRYVYHKKRKEITRTDFLDSYFMVTEWLMGDEELVLHIDDRRLKVVCGDDEVAHFVDIDSGELMLSLYFGEVKYTTDWANELYQWNK